MKKFAVVAIIASAFLFSGCGKSKESDEKNVEAEKSKAEKDEPKGDGDDYRDRFFKRLMRTDHVYQACIEASEIAKHEKEKGNEDSYAKWFLRSRSPECKAEFKKMNEPGYRMKPPVDYAPEDFGR